MTRFCTTLGVALFVLAGTLAAIASSGEAPAVPVGPSTSAEVVFAEAPLPLKVVGTEIRNSRGEKVRLRGVNAASLEWTSNGEGHILDTVKTAITDWHVNLIRLPLAQDRWFGKAREQTDGGTAYRASSSKSSTRVRKLAAT